MLKKKCFNQQIKADLGLVSDRSFMVVLLSYFLFQPESHDWCNKCCGMYYPVCGMEYIKDHAANQKE